MSLEGLESLPTFQLGASALSNPETEVDEVVSLSRDADGWVASMALAALAERDDVPDEWVTWAMRSPVRPSLCEDRLLLRALAVHADRPAIGSVLAVLESLSDDIVAEFVADRTARGEVVDASTFDRVSLDESEALVAFIDRFEGELGPAFRAGFETGAPVATC